MTVRFRDILAARPRVERYLTRTPLHRHPGLCRLLDADVFVKHENHHAVGSFKVRGGVNLAGLMTPEETKSGLYTASSGNHGQSIAFAGRVTGTAVTVAVPEGANPTKVQAMRDLGADVVFRGHDFDEAREWMAGEAAEKGGRFIGPTEPELIAGVGTYALEILEELPDVDAIYAPVGAGSGACGCCLVAKTVNPAIRVVGVQSERAPAVHHSWRQKRAVEADMATRHEGLQTRVSHANAMEILGHPETGLDDFVLVSDDAIEEAIVLFLEHTRNLAEGAGAASLAAALAQREQLAGKRVALVLSGGNLTLEGLAGILARAS